MRLSDYTQSGGRGLFRRDRRLFNQRGTFTFTIPEGVTQIWAFAMGAGGGAHHGDSWDIGTIAGGAGGGYASGIISGLTPGNTLTITIGAGGKGEIRGEDLIEPTAGGDSTVVGGSTTYLQGEGGAKGNEKVSEDIGVIGEGKGGGGTATTSSVTDAYTAAGGGSGTTVVGGKASASVSSGESRIAAGGGASGSPFGTGMNGGKAVMVFANSIAGGGGGWTQKDYQHLTSTQKVPELNNHAEYYTGPPTLVGLSGYGSHHPPSTFFPNPMQEVYATTWGGRGRTAKGGMGMSELSESEVGDPAGEGGNKFVPNYHTVMSAIHGEDANPNWWFPWEIDGGGGGGAYLVDTYSTMFIVGNGASGAGGGGAVTYNVAEFSGAVFRGSMKGGDGGFGGGGGGCMAHLESNESAYFNASMVFLGGRGGNGGGGGSVLAPGAGGHYLGIGGEGGDGCVGLYW